MPGATITRGLLPAFAGKKSGQLIPLLCLAPHGVFHAIPLTQRSGGLLPRPFTLTQHHQLPAVGVSCQLNQLKFAAKRRLRALEASDLLFISNEPTTDTNDWQLMVLGGLFSVTLSVTRDLHPRYPHFHKACRPSVFGLSSGEKFTPAIACHSGPRIP